MVFAPHSGWQTGGTNAWPENTGEETAGIRSNPPTSPPSARACSTVKSWCPPQHKDPCRAGTGEAKGSGKQVTLSFALQPPSTHKSDLELKGLLP